MEKLRINNNSIEVLSPDFIKLKELRTLIASNNELVNIPEEIGHLYFLQKLSLSNNHIFELPDGFFDLLNLKYLYLYGNEFVKINSKVQKLKRLELLNLSKNKLKNLPPEICNLHDLKDFFVDNNCLEAFPVDVNNLVNLTVLSLDSNSIKTLPDNLVRLTNLEHLYIKGNKFNPFPQVLYDLQNKKVGIYGLETKELYNAKLLLSQARNNKLIENYREAIEKYNELLKADTNNIPAMSELAVSYLENGDFELAKNVCEKALTKNSDEILAKEIKATYNSCLSRSNKFTNINDKYISKYNQNPSDVTPYFDLGKYYFDLKKYDTAMYYFQKVVQLNPSYANSHFYIAIVSLIQEQETPFILSALRYLTLEQSGRKTETILPFLFNKMKMKTGVEKTNGNTSYYDSYIIMNDDNEILYKSDNPSAELLGAMITDLAKSNIILEDTIKNDTAMVDLVNKVLHTNENNVEIFQSELYGICKSDTIEIEQKNIFFKEYYLPFFKELINAGHLEAFAYIINNIRQKKINKITDSKENIYQLWLENNSKKVDAFNFWSGNFKWEKK